MVLSWLSVPGRRVGNLLEDSGFGYESSRCPWSLGSSAVLGIRFGMRSLFLELCYRSLVVVSEY